MLIQNAAVTLLILASVSAAHAQGDPARLKSTLAKMDAQSKHFTSAEASFKKEFFNALVKSTDEQAGQIYFIRDDGKTRMGAKTEGAGARTVEYKAGALRIFNPAIKCFDAVPAQGNQAKIESFLTLGFGGSGSDLEKTWTIEDLGPEPIGGVEAEKLVLEPRDVAVRGTVTRVTLWIDLTRDLSLKQVFEAPSHDLQTATYSNVRLNGKVDTKPFEIKGKPCGK